MRQSANYRKELKKLKAFFFDVDGVFSKEFLAFDDAEFYRFMNPKDGFAVRYAVEQGFLVGVITGGDSKSVEDRFRKLGVQEIYLGHRKDKLEVAKEICKKYNLDLSEVLYMGDDIPDYQLMKAVGFSACPADAAIEIQEIADYISDKKGGEGCVRDIIEQTLKAQGKWFNFEN